MERNEEIDALVYISVTDISTKLKVEINHPTLYSNSVF